MPTLELLDQIKTQVGRLAKKPLANCNYSFYPLEFGGAAILAQQVLPQNPDRKFLQVISLNATPIWLAFESGPASRTPVDAAFANNFGLRSVFLIQTNPGFSGGSYWTAFGDTLPTNPITIMGAAGALALVIEGA